VERYALTPADVAWYGTFMQEAFICEGIALYRVESASAP